MASKIEAGKKMLHDGMPEALRSAERLATDPQAPPKAQSKARKLLQSYSEKVRLLAKDPSYSVEDRTYLTDLSARIRSGAFKN